jgi:hypothetical protein
VRPHSRFLADVLQQTRIDPMQLTDLISERRAVRDSGTNFALHFKQSRLQRGRRTNVRLIHLGLHERNTERLGKPSPFFIAQLKNGPFGLRLIGVLHVSSSLQLPSHQELLSGAKPNIFQLRYLRLLQQEVLLNASP